MNAVYDPFEEVPDEPTLEQVAFMRQQQALDKQREEEWIEEICLEYDMDYDLPY